MRLVTILSSYFGRFCAVLFVVVAATVLVMGFLAHFGAPYVVEEKKDYIMIEQDPMFLVGGTRFVYQYVLQTEGAKEYDFERIVICDGSGHNLYLIRFVTDALVSSVAVESGALLIDEKMRKAFTQRFNEIKKTMDVGRFVEPYLIRSHREKDVEVKPQVIPPPILPRQIPRSLPPKKHQKLFEVLAGVW